MPLRDDLLTPIEGENPSGPDLRYDKVFLQIEEARTEDDESIPSGDWGRTAKKADRVLVIKLAGDLLAKRTKDLRVAGWYLESLVRREGFSQVAGGIDLLWKLQTEFWDTLHPAKDEDDGNLDLRVGAVEKSALFLASALKTLPLTRSGITWVQHQDATAIGFEEQATTPDRITARTEAIERGALTGEDLQKSIEGTPKAFYVELEAQLTESLALLEGMDAYQQEAYGDDYPSVSRLKSTLEALKFIASSTLFEKRKTDPDPVAEPEPEQEPEPEPIAEAEPAPAVAAVKAAAPAAARAVPMAAGSAPRTAPAAAGVPASAPDTAQGASERVLLAAEFLQGQDSNSAVPYLLCSALRLGETRTADLNDVLFNVAPSTETRQSLRRLAAAARWDELLLQSLRALTEPCGRVWLDLQRYIWRAAEESSRVGISTAVVSQMRALLTDVPELRDLMMDDDTPAANAETRQWLEEVVLPVAGTPAISTPREPAKPAATPARVSGKAAAPDIFDTAQEMLNGGRTAEAVSMLLRDSEQQPSGRMRFLRRVQVAQLCLTANQFAVAYPMLRDLSAEIEKRTLESWEAAEMLSTPLALYLRCLVQRDASSSEREEIFERLCRLDPQAALLAGVEE